MTTQDLGCRRTRCDAPMRGAGGSGGRGGERRGESRRVQGTDRSLQRFQDILPAGRFYPVAQLLIDVGQDKLCLTVPRSSSFGQVFAHGWVDEQAMAHLNKGWGQVFAHGWADEQVMAHLNRVADAINATDTDEDAVGALNLHLNGRRTSSRR